MITTVWALVSKQGASESRLFATEEIAEAYPGSLVRDRFDIKSVERDVVFIVMERGEHYDGGDTIEAVVATLALAQAIVDRGHQDDLEIEVWEVQS